MSNTPLQDLPLQGVSSASVQTVTSRTLLQPTTDPSASRRVSFYRSGDTQFGGHHMVINGRTFKTFDALLDTLSKKVPLPFGVRTITTPRGTHPVRTLEDLHDGGSYVCSDQKRVKPLNLDVVNRRQVPWNTTRLVSAGRRKQRGVPAVPPGRRNKEVNRPSRLAVRTPKRLVVFKNRDPNVWRTIMLHKRTAPSFDALLDYLSQVLQFRVVKLYTSDGRRVDGLPGLILCSGVIVASGNEPFRPGNYDPQRSSQMAQLSNSESVEASRLQPLTYKNKSSSSGTRSRNFSLSSERYVVNQINKSSNGSSNGHRAQRSIEADIDHRGQGSVDMETCAGPESRQHTSIVPQDDDIEKSFRVNEDGSMTVEMKVRLTIKEEEMIHWTTTLSRSSLSNHQRTLCASKSGSVNSSPDSNDALPKDSTAASEDGEDETKEDNRPIRTAKGVAFATEGGYDKCTVAAVGGPNSRRTPTPGVSNARRKRASVESVKVVTENGIQESTTGTYSYTERNADGEMTEGYCVVRQNTSSSRPVPKPRQTGSAGPRCNGSQSPLKSSGVAEVLQIQGDGMEITETVMHIYEGQGCYDNYFANSQYSMEGGPENMPRSKPASTDSGPRSSSNDVDFTRQSSSTDSQHRGREEILSLSSEPMSPLQKMCNNLSPFTDNEAHTMAGSRTRSPPKDTECLKSGSEETPGKVEKKKKTVKMKPKLKSPTSTTSSDKKQKDNVASSSKSTKTYSSPEKSSTSGKKSGTGTESDKNLQNGPKTEKVKKKHKASGVETTTTKNKGLALNIDNVNGTSSKKQLNMNKKGARDSLLNVNTPDSGVVRPAMKKNMLNILSPKHLGQGKKKITKQKSMNENRLASPKLNSELSESVSMPALPSAPSDAQEYVENWLQKITAEPVPYEEEVASAEPEHGTKVIFQIGADSESEIKAEEGQDSTGDGCLPHKEIHKSMSCLSVPVAYEAPPSHLLNTQAAQRKGLCISMPSVRIDPKEQESRLRMHKSAAAIVVERESPPTTNHLSPTATIRPVLRQLCSSIQSLRRASGPDNLTSLEKSHSVPDFSSQVASVFGSPSKALLSFLSVRTLRESLKGDSYAGDSRSGSEAMLVMESLQKISAIGDEEELRASLSELQSRTSSQLRQSWKDFQERRDMLESQPLSPKFSEQEFALDVASEVGEDHSSHMFEMEQLMEELDMPQELREQLSTLVGAGPKMYPQYETDVSCAETLKNRRHSDSEEDLELFAGERDKASEVEAGPEDSHVGRAVQEEEGRERSSVEPEEGDNPHNVHEDLVEKEAGDTETVQHSEHHTESDEGGLTEADRTESNREERADCRSTTADRQEKLSLKSGSDQGKSDAEVGSLAEAVQSGEEDTGHLEPEHPAKQSEDDVNVCDSAGSEREEEKEVEETQEEGEDGDGDTEHGDEGEGGEGMEQERVEEDEDLVVETDEVEDMEQLQVEAEEEVNQMEEDEDKEEVQSDGEDMLRGIVEEEEVAKEIEEDEDREEEGNMEEDEEMLGGRSDAEERGERWDDEEERDEKRVDEEELEEEGEEERDEKRVDEEESEEKREEEEESEEEVGEEREETGEIEEEGVEEKEAEEKRQEEDEEVPDTGSEVEDREETWEDEDVKEEDVDDTREKVGDEDERGEDEGENVEEVDETQEKDGEEDERGEDEGENVDEEETQEDGLEVHEREEDEEEEEEEREGGQSEGEERGDECEDEEKEQGEHEEEIQDNEEDEEERDEEHRCSAESDVENLVKARTITKILEEATYMEEKSSCEESKNSIEEAETNISEDGDLNSGSNNSSLEIKELDGQGTDTANELKTEEGEEDEEDDKERNHSTLPHPVEISQELLDFVNSALMSSSLTFTYDSKGNIRIEPDSARIVPTKEMLIPKKREDSQYGKKRLPSPNTSDLSDYRPETSESGGYKSQMSTDLSTESGEEDSEAHSVRGKHTFNTSNGGLNRELTPSKVSTGSKAEIFNPRLKSGGSFTSYDSNPRASAEDLSYYSAGSSSKPYPEPVRSIPLQTDVESGDGVLIDQGRWLLKENHLIRKSPPVSTGMYSNLDNTSGDTARSNSSEDLPHNHCANQHSALAVLSSSELEEMAKPATPNCSYYNMPHDSDSDPFQDNLSVGSGRVESRMKRDVRVSPTVDTSKTWVKKNGSMSSFASVEFKMADGKVHPEVRDCRDSRLAVEQPSRSQNVVRRALPSRESLESLHVNCGQYCPIL
ncbi:oxygen-regulated protein 1 [Osmerus mordax]|uniref:oxygen-regulated protein 1 n=1 Tax=Osmerus mordax TaxID=8014 RepID=UPI0035102955